MICPNCGNVNTAKDGKTQKGTQRYRCHECGNRFSEATESNKDNAHIRQQIIAFIKNGAYFNIEILSKKLKIDKEELKETISEMKESGYNIEADGNIVRLVQSREGGKLTIKMPEMKVVKIGVTSDNHIGSTAERNDVLNWLYDRFESEGIKTVLNCGNMIDGERKGINEYELKTRGLDGQIDYFISQYPKREGIETKFITGTCHEGWWESQVGISIGRYIESRARDFGRTDLEFIGHIESDVVLKTSGGQATIKMMHPGGGSAYALSYSPQKIVESFTGGEKPSILLVGHYHKMDYTYWRNVHCIQVGCTQDQTAFMRKKRLSAHLGGVILEIEQSQDGAVHSVKVQFLTAFDTAYYKGKGYYELEA